MVHRIHANIDTHSCARYHCGCQIKCALECVYTLNECNFRKTPSHNWMTTGLAQSLASPYSHHSLHYLFRHHQRQPNAEAISHLPYPNCEHSRFCLYVCALSLYEGPRSHICSVLPTDHIMEDIFANCWRSNDIILPLDERASHMAAGCVVVVVNDRVTQMTTYV